MSSARSARRFVQLLAAQLAAGNQSDELEGKEQLQRKFVAGVEELPDGDLKSTLLASIDRHTEQLRLHIAKEVKFIASSRTTVARTEEKACQNPPFNLLVDGGLKALLSTCEAEEHSQRLALGRNLLVCRLTSDELQLIVDDLFKCKDNKSEDALVVADFCNNALLGLSSLEHVNIVLKAMASLLVSSIDITQNQEAGWVFLYSALYKLLVHVDFKVSALNLQAIISVPSIVLSLLQMASLQSVAHQLTYHDIIAALLSHVVDLMAVSSQQWDLDRQKQEQMKVISLIITCCGNSLHHISDVILQASLPSSVESAGCLSTVYLNLFPHIPKPTTVQEYVRYVAAVRQVNCTNNLLNTNSDTVDKLMKVASGLCVPREMKKILQKLKGQLSEQCYGHKNNDLTLHLINSASDNDVEVLLDLVADSKLEQLAAESRKEDSLAMDGKSVCVSDSPAVGHDTSIFFVDAAGDPELAGTLDVMDSDLHTRHISESEDDDLSTTLPDADSTEISVTDISRLSQKDSSPDQTVQFIQRQTRKRMKEVNDSECEEADNHGENHREFTQSTPLHVEVNSQSLLSHHSMKKRKKDTTGLVSKQTTL